MKPELNILIFMFVLPFVLKNSENILLLDILEIPDWVLGKLNGFHMMDLWLLSCHAWLSCDKNLPFLQILKISCMNGLEDKPSYHPAYMYIQFAMFSRAKLISCILLGNVLSKSMCSVSYFWLMLNINRLCLCASSLDDHAWNNMYEVLFWNIWTIACRMDLKAILRLSWYSWSLVYHLPVLISTELSTHWDTPAGLKTSRTSWDRIFCPLMRPTLSRTRWHFSVRLFSLYKRESNRMVSFHKSCHPEIWVKVKKPLVIHLKWGFQMISYDWGTPWVSWVSIVLA